MLIYKGLKGFTYGKKWLQNGFNGFTPTSPVRFTAAFLCPISRLCHQFRYIFIMTHNAASLAALLAALGCAPRHASAGRLVCVGPGRACDDFRVAGCISAAKQAASLKCQSPRLRSLRSHGLCISASRQSYNVD